MASSAIVRADIPAAIDRAARLSRYVSQLLAADPSLANAAFEQPFAAEDMRAALAGECSDEAGLHRKLRKLRQAVMLRLIVRDLSGLADLAEVIAGATSLAEH